MTTVVGVDPSLTATGLCTWRDGRFYVDTIVTPSTMPAAERHHVIVTRVLRMADPSDVGRAQPRRTVFVVEGLLKPGGDALRGNSYLELAELRGVLNYALHIKGFSRVDVNPMTLKLYATGNGRASKQSMLDAARGRLGHLFAVRNDNEADAGWLCVMGLHRYGMPLARPALPAKNLRALNVPTWAPFTLEGDHGD